MFARDVLTRSAHVYDLFTVVVHDGTLTSGHYINYSRWRDAVRFLVALFADAQWYRYDDDKITRVNVSQVMDAKAYQLFYVRRALHNQSNHGL